MSNIFYSVSQVSGLRGLQVITHVLMARTGLTYSAAPGCSHINWQQQEPRN